MAQPAFLRDIRVLLERYLRHPVPGGGLSVFWQLFDEMQFDCIHWAHSHTGLKTSEHVAFLLFGACRLVREPGEAFSHDYLILSESTPLPPQPHPQHIFDNPQTRSTADRFPASPSLQPQPKQASIQSAALFATYALFHSQPGRGTSEQVPIRMDAATWHLLTLLAHDTNLTQPELKSVRAVLKYLVQTDALIAVERPAPPITVPVNITPKRVRSLVDRMTPALLQDPASQSELEATRGRKYRAVQAMVESPFVDQAVVENALRAYRVAKGSLRQSAKTMDVRVPRLVTGGLVIELRDILKVSRKQ